MRVAPLATAQEVYFPPRGEWETREPAEVGMDADWLQGAIELSLAHENPAELFLTPPDFHYSKAGHRLVAEHLTPVVASKLAR